MHILHHCGVDLCRFFGDAAPGDGVAAFAAQRRGTLLQFAFFSGKVVKRLSYLWRMVLFAALMLAVVSACAVGFGWFPVADARSWLFFVGLFLVLFAAISLAFEVGFRLRRKVYDALGRYKKDRAE